MAAKSATKSDVCERNTLNTRIMAIIMARTEVVHTADSTKESVGDDTHSLADGRAMPLSPGMATVWPVAK